jgi:hypothetical protein
MHYESERYRDAAKGLQANIPRARMEGVLFPIILCVWRSCNGRDFFNEREKASALRKCRVLSVQIVRDVGPTVYSQTKRGDRRQKTNSLSFYFPFHLLSELTMHFERESVSEWELYRLLFLGKICGQSNNPKLKRANFPFCKYNCIVYSIIGHFKLLRLG